jgi:hypothetical protein
MVFWLWAACISPLILECRRSLRYLPPSRPVRKSSPWVVGLPRRVDKSPGARLARHSAASGKQIEKQPLRLTEETAARAQSPVFALSVESEYQSCLFPLLHCQSEGLCRLKDAPLGCCDSNAVIAGRRARIRSATATVVHVSRASSTSNSDDDYQQEKKEPRPASLSRKKKE